MDTQRDETWWKARADREEGHYIGAGALALDPQFSNASRPQLVEREQSRVAFGKFIELMRRSKGWTVEELASEADLDIGDVLLIEDDLTVLPEPRAVYQLAKVFKIPQTNLMQVSGLTVPRDPALRQETVRFAARSQSVEKLSDSERVALEQFVSVLSQAAIESASDQSDTARTTADVDKQIEKVLRGLGNPEPPLDLRVVRELLRLDRNFYDSEDDGVLKETVSKLKIAGIQVLKRPALLREAIRKFSLKALYLPDQKRILLDKALPQLKHRWSEAHEIGHSVIPWHDGMMLGDDKQTLLPLCHEQMEAEANYAAGQLLFLGSRFRSEALDYLPTLENVKKLAATYGNTGTSTLWRFIEECHRDVPMFALVSGHPHVARRTSSFDPNEPCRYYVQSPAFRLRFADHTDIHMFGLIASYCGAQRGGMLGQGELRLNDVNQTLYMFDCQTFFNRYDALTLGVWRRICPVSSFA